MTSIPIVDISLNWETVSTEVDKALSQVGFLYLTGHGISNETVEKVFAESRKFFELDLETKNGCNSIDDERKTFGYDGRNEAFQIGNKYRESFNMPPYPFDGILEKLNPDVSPVVTSMFKLAEESEPLIKRILKVFAKSLKLGDESYFAKRCLGLSDASVSNLTRLKTIYYPYVNSLKPGMERCSTHADFGLLTLLWQDEGGGLEVLTKEGSWIAAKYIPGAVLVNTGNLLNYWSGGRYPATIHRVGVSEHEVKNHLDRQSLAYFIIPDDEVLIAPLLSHLPNYVGEISKSTDAVTVRDYMKKQLDSVYKQ